MFKFSLIKFDSGFLFLLHQQQVLSMNGSEICGYFDRVLNYFEQLSSSYNK